MSEYRGGLHERLSEAQAQTDALRPGPEAEQKEETLRRLWSVGVGGVGMLLACACSQIAIWGEKALTTELITGTVAGIVAVATVATFRSWRAHVDSVTETNKVLNSVADAASTEAISGFLIGSRVANRPPTGDPHDN